MRKTVCYCDACKKEIEFYEMTTIKISDNGWSFDFCLDCWNKINSSEKFLNALKTGMALDVTI